MDVLMIVNRFHPNVKTVRDARATVYLEVTKKHVAESHKKSHKTCAMAVACMQKFHLDGAIISRKVAYLVKGDIATRYILPGSVSREVVSFDRGASFEPGDYQLSKPSANMRLGHSRMYDKSKGTPRTQSKGVFLRHVTTNIRARLVGENK